MYVNENIRNLIILKYFVLKRLEVNNKHTNFSVNRNTSPLGSFQIQFQETRTCYKARKREVFSNTMFYCHIKL